MADDSSSSAASDNEEQKQEKTTIADDIVVTKYKMAAEITNRKPPLTPLETPYIDIRNHFISA